MTSGAPGMTPAQRLAALEQASEKMHAAWIHVGNTAVGNVDAVLASLRADVEAPAPAQVTREQLQSIEWVGRLRRDIPGYCPACRATPLHEPDCWLSAALSAAPPAPTPQLLRVLADYDLRDQVHGLGPEVADAYDAAVAAPAPTGAPIHETTTRMVATEPLRDVRAVSLHGELRASEDGLGQPTDRVRDEVQEVAPTGAPADLVAKLGELKQRWLTYKRQPPRSLDGYDIQQWAVERENKLMDIFIRDLDEIAAWHPAAPTGAPAPSPPTTEITEQLGDTATERLAERLEAYMDGGGRHFECSFTILREIITHLRAKPVPSAKKSELCQPGIISSSAPARLDVLRRAVEAARRFLWCGQCGAWRWERACGPTHATVFAERELLITQLDAALLVLTPAAPALPPVSYEAREEAIRKAIHCGREFSMAIRDNDVSSQERGMAHRAEARRLLGLPALPPEPELPNTEASVGEQETGAPADLVALLTRVQQLGARVDDSPTAEQWTEYYEALNILLAWHPAAPALPPEYLPCQVCGGPHRYDTTVPSPLWNRVIRAHGVPEFLCLSCIVQVFAEAGENLTAELWGQTFNGTPLDIRVAALPPVEASVICECGHAEDVHSGGACCLAFGMCMCDRFRRRPSPQAVK